MLFNTIMEVVWLTHCTYGDMIYPLGVICDIKPATNDFGCICGQIWKKQCRMKAYIAINQNKWYQPKLCKKLVLAMKNFFTFVMPVK